MCRTTLNPGSRRSRQLNPGRDPLRCRGSGRDHVLDPKWHLLFGMRSFLPGFAYCECAVIAVSLAEGEEPMGSSDQSLELTCEAAEVANLVLCLHCHSIVDGHGAVVGATQRFVPTALDSIAFTGRRKSKADDALFGADELARWSVFRSMPIETSSDCNTTHRTRLRACVFLPSSSSVFQDCGRV